MEAAWLNRLKHLAENKPIVVLTFDGGEWEGLRESRRGVNEFTVARSHASLEGIRVPTPCLIYGNDDDGEHLYFGLISSRGPVTTLESRIKIRRSLQIQPQSKSELLRLVTEKPHARNLEERLHGSASVVTLSPKLSSHVIERLASIDFNRGAMRAVAESLSAPKYFQGAAALQEDALQTALKAFNLSSGDRALSLELVEGQETALARVPIMEDSVIEHDARYIPGYNLAQSYMTGRAIFERGNERLEVFTANRRSLEHVFGVDLIYMNETRQSIVMLQYKMLEPLRKDAADTDWVYRPDNQLDGEILRMQRFAADHRPSQYEYRLNSAVFFLKFVKRDGLIRNGAIIMPIDHFEKLRRDPAFRGPQGGLRVSYDSLAGRYLRQSDFLNLVRSGYIGAHAETTAYLRTLVEAVLQNNRAVVAAIQRRTEDSLTMRKRSEILTLIVIDARSIFCGGDRWDEALPYKASQGDGFGEDMLSHIGRQSPFCDHIHRTVHEVLQILLEPHEIQERAPFFEGHEQVEVAILTAFASGQGAEDTHVLRPMLQRKFEDFCTVILKDR